ncbi:hypothetical protein MKW98_013076 [Papaver atlanticum]|uniref:Peptidase S54 rhomboid domain-containing protein n=1 Tax=Papaver atlanticum TaxID=357466 RepID=A0AAD4T8B1_9MAGN|nr:hypothetical protein MKW98_013076 [Papaver atlanticum]
MGGALPMPFSQFPVSSNCSTPVYLIGTATALRLGEVLHHSSRKHNLRLGAILSSSFKGLSHFSHVFGSKEVWCGRKSLFEGVGFLELSSFSSTRSSCISFFSGKENEKHSVSKGHSDLETARRNSLDGRLWTNVLLGLNVLFFVAQMATHGKLMLWGAKINSLIDKGQFWRFATSSLLHANIAHLMINCYSLNSIGPTVESISGPGRFLSVYFTSAVTSSAMSYWFCPAPAVGASGAIFGLVGSFAVFVLRHRSLVGNRKEMLQHVAQVIALNMVIGLLSKGIDNWGHLGGLLGGAAMSWFVGPAWTYEGWTSDGKSVFVDKAPFSHITKRRSE